MFPAELISFSCIPPSVYSLGIMVKSFSRRIEFHESFRLPHFDVAQYVGYGLRFRILRR